MSTRKDFVHAQPDVQPTHGDVGFVVHPTWRVRRDIPEIHLYGRLNSGETFLLIETRCRPGFYVRTSDASRVRGVASRFGGELKASPRQTMDGEATQFLSTITPNQLGFLRHALAEVGIRTYEADISFPWSYLIDRHLRGSVEIHGTWYKGEHVNRVYVNPRLLPADAHPQLVSASISLDLHPQNGSLQAVAIARMGSMAARHTSATYVIAGHGRQSSAEYFESERDLLLTFQHSLRSLDPDIIIGWDIDSRVLVPLRNRMAACDIAFNLGRSDRLSRAAPFSAASSGWGPVQTAIEGRQILNARSIACSGHRRFEDTELATISQDVLGRIPNSPAERAEAALDILEADHLIQLTVRRSMLIGIPLQRAWTSVQAFDFLYLSELHQRSIVAPTRNVDRRGGSPAPGGLILSPQAGSARNVLVLDFKSLYPSIIRTFNIDPATQVIGATNRDDVIVAPNGAAFTREPGILPMILNRFFESRDKAKARGDNVASYAYKIIMNSFYGVLGTSSCRFASQSLSGAITSFGQHILRWTRDSLQNEGLSVIYGDTDSLFVDAGRARDTSLEEAVQFGRSLAARVNEQLSAYLASTFGVTSQLELEMEKAYVRFFLPTIRGEERGRAKGYAGLVVDQGGEHVDVVGMEAVRRDWTPLARRFQRELLDLAFHDAPMETVAAHVKDTIRQLRQGRLDAELVYQKSLRKPVFEYTKVQPTHVQAATLLTQQPSPGDVIRYVMTLRGPQPIDHIDAPIDYAHIIQKQLQPIAESLAGLITLPPSLFGSGQIDLFD